MRAASLELCWRWCASQTRGCSGAPKLTSFLNTEGQRAPGLLMDLLMDSPESAVTGRIGRHGPTRESPGQADFSGAAVIGRHGREPPHNPKVAGSNPAPATNEREGPGR